VLLTTELGDSKKVVVIIMIIIMSERPLGIPLLKPQQIKNYGNPEWRPGDMDTNKYHNPAHCQLGNVCSLTQSRALKKSGSNLATFRDVFSTQM
jgi:hypothetical protein